MKNILEKYQALGLKHSVVYQKLNEKYNFFGKDSLFQNINRTATYIGKSKLAILLQSHLSNNDIVQNQKAIISPIALVILLTLYITEGSVVFRTAAISLFFVNMEGQPY